MDILNWIYLVKNKLRKTTIQNPDKDLVILGADVGFSKRGDGYLSYGMHVTDFAKYINESAAGNCPIQMHFKPGSIGEKVSFRKESGTDPNTFKDVIIPGKLEITRGSNSGIYNIALESSFNSGISPQNTTWNTQYVDPANTSWVSLWDVQNRSYTTWRNAGDGADDYVIPQYVGMPAVMKYDDGDIVRYWLIMFTEWGVGGYNEYGFAYDRYEILPEVYFEKPDYQTDVVDIISPGVHIKRNDNGGIYNAVTDPYSEQGASPRKTKWNSLYIDSRPGYSGWDDLSNLESRKYTSFVDALNGAVGDNIEDTDLVMWDMTTDLYYKISFNNWTQNGNGGGFSYYRTVIPQSCGIKFADGTVMNTATTGSSAPITSGPIATDGTTLYSTDPAAGPNFNTSNGIFLGQGAGQNAISASNSNFFGVNAGINATNAYYSNFFGHQSGVSATNASSSNFFGLYSGNYATNASNSNFFGERAGLNAAEAYNSNFLGQNAGDGATNAHNSNFLGHTAGAATTNANNSNFIGAYAGHAATEAYDSNFLGQQAGGGATDANNSNFFGLNAGTATTNANNSNFLGNEAGSGSINCGISNFLGLQAGRSANGSYGSNFLGNRAGYNTTNTYKCNFLGYKAGDSSVGNNVNAIGDEAGIGNALSGQTIFSNASMPTFANHAAAAAAINVGTGGSAGSTYLYHNQATNSIGAVRL